MGENRPLRRIVESPDRGTRVLVVAGVRLYRDGLLLALAQTDSITLVGAVGDWHEALPLIGARRPQIVLLDTDHDERLDAVRRLSVASSTVRVIALAVREPEATVVPLAEAGISGYVTCEDSLERLVVVIESIARGELLCSPRVAAQLIRHVASLSRHDLHAGPSDLTVRELEILELIDCGLSNREIAGRLYIEHSTVKNHVHNILEKLHVSHRADAVARVKGVAAVSRR